MKKMLNTIGIALLAIIALLKEIRHCQDKRHHAGIEIAKSKLS